MKKAVDAKAVSGQNARLVARLEEMKKENSTLVHEMKGLKAKNEELEKKLLLHADPAEALLQELDKAEVARLQQGRTPPSSF